MTEKHVDPGADNTEVDGTTRSSWAAGPSEGSAEDVFVAQLRRRRAASWRCAVLRSGVRDPYRDRRGPLTVDELDAWIAALQHLAAHGRDVRWAAPADVRALLEEPAA